MEILISVKSREMPAARIQKWFRLTAFLFACLVLSRGAWADNAGENHRVLVFYLQARSTAAVALADREIRELLEKQTTYLYADYIETTLSVDPPVQQKIREWYLQKYRDHQPDVIIGGGSTPIPFMTGAYRQKV